MTTAYCDLAYLQFGAMTPGDLQAINALYAGFIDSAILDESAYVDSRLTKRYSCPFTAPVPIAVKRWVRDLVLPRVLDRRGTNPKDNDLREQLEKNRDRALEEIKEAADSKEGLFDLPLRADTNATGVVGAAPILKVETSPYAWIDTERDLLSGR